MVGGTGLKSVTKLVRMNTSGKSVKLFNLEDRKNTTGSITEVDIFQWKNTLLDNLRREPEFAEHCKENSKWEFEKTVNRGFEDEVNGDGRGKQKADQVTSMLTKIASYAPKSIVREITRRTKCLADIWNIARDWAGIQSSGSKHLEYYKIKMSYLKVDKEESKQEFYYRLRDAMEDTLIMRKDNMTDDGEIVTEDEDMTPTVKSMVVLDWLDAIGGPPLVEHVHRVYAKELETTTLASIQTRIWKNMTSLMREIENNDVEDQSNIHRCNLQNEASCRQVGSTRGRGKEFNRGRGRIQNKQRSSNLKYQGRVQSGSQGSRQSGNFMCKLCKASGSSNFRSHDISECWLLSEHDRNGIIKASAKAQALFALTEDDVYQEHEDFEESENEFEDEEQD